MTVPYLNRTGSHLTKGELLRAVVGKLEAAATWGRL